MAAIRHDRGKAIARPSLDDIFSGPDEFGLLDVTAKRIGSHAPLEETNFEAINAFVDQHQRVPNDHGDLTEKLLARRLATYVANTRLRDALLPYDRHGLLSGPAEAPGKSEQEPPQAPPPAPISDEPEVEAPA